MNNIAVKNIFVDHNIPEHKSVLLLPEKFASSTSHNVNYSLVQCLGIL